jgi:hypothetical protein
MRGRARAATPDRTYRERMMVRRSDCVFLAAVLAIVAAVVVGLWYAGVARFAIE